MNRFRFAVTLIAFLFACTHALAQKAGGSPESSQQSSPETACMPGMAMPGCPETAQVVTTGLMTMQPSTFVQKIASHTDSGTSAEPTSTPAGMLMTMRGSWMFMFHANAFLLDQQQTSSRGGDKFFSTNWVMPMAQRQVGHGVVAFRTMLSFEPATITGRQYPLLFQQGETAFGKPIADAQHPHDFFMELASLYDLKLGENGLLSFYAAPIGDPALGPTGFSHRASASENPLATLGHHQQDSTHIAADVVTAGITYKIARVEVSGFHGREPNENRWNIDQGKMDSWSTRLTLAPANNWTGQFSYGRIHSPESLSPGANQNRMTASFTYNRPFTGGNWASTVVWGRTKSLPDADIFNSYLAESTIRFRTSNYVWTRLESAERSNELIVGENPIPAGFREVPVGRVLATTLGYDRDLHLIPKLACAFGAQFTIYRVPESLQPIYGTGPAGVAIFLRVRPESRKK